MQNKGILNKLERKFGKYAIKNLIVYILICYAIGYALVLISTKTNIYQYVTLSPELVMQGQVWRLFTWIFTVPQTLSFWVVFMFLFYFFIGKTLEKSIGAFKYNVFMISGWLFMTLGAMIVYWITTAVYGPGLGVSMDVSTYYLNLASFLAFALLYPDTKVYLFFVLPVKMLWLAILDVAYLVYKIIQYVIAIAGSNLIDFSAFGITESYYKATLYAQIFSIVISLLNFVIFFIIYRRSTGRTFKDKFNNMKRKKAFERSKKAGANEAYNAQTDNQVKRWEENLKKQKERQNSANADSEKTETEFDDNAAMGAWGQWYNPNMTDEERERLQKEYEDKLMAEEQAKEDEKAAAAKRRAEQREEKLIKKRKAYTSKYGSQEYQHKCEICGRTNVSDPDLAFRFCSKCDGNHEYCEEHIFNHEHIRE